LFNTLVLTGAEYSLLEGIFVGFGHLGAAIAFLEDICVALGEFDVGVGRVSACSLFRGRGLDEQVHQFGGVDAYVIGLGSGYSRRRTEVAG